MSLQGRHLVQLLAKLDAMELELIQIVQWLDRQDEPGNSRTASLIDSAATSIGAAARQVMREREAEAQAQAEAQARAAQAQADAQARWLASQGYRA